MAETNPYKGYLAKIKGAESRGVATAKNPKSSASGLYQFTKGTWEGLGYNWADRFNTSLQEEAATKFTDYNARYLKKRLGISPTDADLYGAHFMGPATYAKLYKTSDTTPVSFVMSQDAINANKSVVYDKKGRLKTVGEIRQWLTKKMSAPVSENMYTKSNFFDPNQDFNYDRDPVSGVYTDDQEDLEAEDAKKELFQKQQERDFLAEAQSQFAQAQQSQGQLQSQQEVAEADASLYQLPQIALPEYGESQVMEKGGTIGNRVTCTDCGWSWDKSESSKEDMYNCHKCGGTHGEDSKYQEGGDTLSKYVLKPGARLIADGLRGADNLVDKVFNYIKPNGLEQETREDIFRRFRPTSYPDMTQAAIDYFAKNDTKPARDKQGDYDVSEEAWRKALDLPTKSKYIAESKYKPTTAKDKNAKYYTLNNIIDPNKITEYVKSRNGKVGDKFQQTALVPYMRDDVKLNAGNSNADPLENFQISVGEDKKGKYAAIYDKYDFDSFKAANRVIKPYEIYDRYYYKRDGGYQYPNFQVGGQNEEEPKVVQVRDKDGKITPMLSDSKEYKELYNSGSLNTKDEQTGEYTYYLPEVTVQAKSKPRSTPMLQAKPMVISEYRKKDIEALLQEAAPVRSSIPDYQRMEEVEFTKAMKQEEKVKSGQAVEQGKINKTISLKSQLEDRIEDKKLEPLKYKTKEDIIKVQSFLASQGYDLNPESKFKNNGIDGYLGNATKKAISNYNSGLGSSGYYSVKEGVGLLGKCAEKQCSEYVQNEDYRNIKPDMSREEWNKTVGMYGDAWEIGRNIVKAGGSEIKEKSKVKPGDVVTMYTGGDSAYQAEADRAGTGTTHTGIVDKVNPDGTYYILHNVHKGNKEDGFEGQEFRDLVKNGTTGTHNFTVKHAFRPNLDDVKKSPKKVVSEKFNLRIDPKAASKLSEGDYNNIFTSASAKQKLEQSFIKPLNDPKNKSIISKVFNLGDDEYNSLAKGSLGILGQESEFATNRQYTTGAKQIGATLARFTGLKSDEVSKGAGQLKYETNFGEDDLTELGIDRYNFDNEENASLTTMYKLAKDYKGFLKKGYNKKDAIYRAITVYNSSLGKKVKGKTIEDFAKKYDVDYTNKVLNYSNAFEVVDDKKSYKTTSDNLLLNPNVGKWRASLKKQNKL
jgi:hypothetical protein